MNFVTPLVVNDEPQKKDFDFSKFEEKLQFKQLYKAYMRTRLSEAQNWKCCYCERTITEQKNKTRTATLEHVDPYSKSKDDSWDNLAAACRKCNSKRGSSCWKEFLANTTKDLSTFETKMAKKVRKYVKRSEKFRHDMKTMKTWLETVKLPTSYKKELMLKLNLPQEMEKLYYE